jgi:hypothetical protein
MEYRSIGKEKILDRHEFNYFLHSITPSLQYSN